MKIEPRECDSQIVLSDGRKLGFATYGNPQGRPVIYNHGGLSCRIDATSCHEAATKLGVRVIAPDRPGVGLSDRHKGAVLLDWPTDVAQLLDSLDIERCAVMGWSFGGAYAAACGYALPQVTDTVLIASGIPCDWPGMRDEINKMDERFMKLSRHAGFIDEAAFVVMKEMALHKPDMFISQTISELSPQSANAITRNPKEFIDATVQAFVHPGGALDDYRIWDKPWGFELSELKTATQIWHGAADELCPPDWASRLAKTIDDSNLHIVEDAGHFVARDHWEEILAAIA